MDAPPNGPPEEWVPVEIKKGRPSRQATKTALHKQRLMEIFRRPPEDYDGTNAKLAEYMELSARQVGRLLKQLEEDGLIKIQVVRYRKTGGGFCTNRTILLPRET